MFTARKNRVPIALALAAALWLALAGAAQAQEFWGTRPIGMGGAFSAVANDVDAIEWNPAGLSSLTRRKQMGFELSYEHHEYLFGDYPYLHPNLVQQNSTNQFGSGYFNDTGQTESPKTKFREDWYHLAIADGYVNKFVAFGGAITSQDVTNNLFKHGTEYRADVAFAGGFEDLVSLGGTASWVNFDPTGESKGRFQMNVGALVNAKDMIKVGLVGRNLMGDDYPLIVRRELALGVAGYVMHYATISIEATKVFDGVKKLSGPLYQPKGTFVFAGGVEGTIAKVVALRGGFNWDQLSGARMYSAGISFVDVHGTLGYTFQGSVDHVKDFTHSVQFVFYYP